MYNMIITLFPTPPSFVSFPFLRFLECPGMRVIVEVGIARARCGRSRNLYFMVNVTWKKGG